MNAMKWLFAAAATGLLVCASCGSDEATTTASNGMATPGADGAAGGSLPGSDATPTDRTGSLLDLLDALPIPDSGPAAACALCVRDQCAASLQACLTDTACQRGIACALTTCAASVGAGGGTAAGGLDVVCALGCFGGDLTVAMKAMGALTCVSGTCSSACAALVPAEAGPDARADARTDGGSDDVSADAGDAASD